MTTQKPIELDYFPVRNGGEDQLHSHSSYRPTPDERENCGACAQLENDFTWLRFNDAMAHRASEFGTVEDAMKYAVLNVEEQAGRKVGAKAYRDRVAAAA